MSDPFLQSLYQPSDIAIDAHNFNNNKIQVASYRNKRTHHCDLMSPPLLQSIPEQSRTKHKNICTPSRTTATQPAPNTPPIGTIAYNKHKPMYPLHKTKKRRASQPHLHPHPHPHETTMMYSPIPIDSNSPSPLSPHNTYYTKPQPNEPQKQYTTKHRRYSLDTAQHSLPNDITFHHTTKRTRTQCKSIETTTTQYAISNEYNNPYIDASITASTYHSPSIVSTPPLPPVIMRYKNHSNTPISRRKSPLIHKKRNKNQTERCKSYDHSYGNDNEDDYANSKIGTSSKKTKRKRKTSTSDSAKRRKKKKKRKKKRRSKHRIDGCDDRGQSALFNKQILRVREGKLGQRVVTFSRRKSVIDASNPADKTKDGADEKALLDLQKSLDEERKQLNEERVRMESLLSEMNDASEKLEKERNEYKEKQAKLLRDEIAIVDQTHKLKQKENVIRRQRRELVTQTQRFDRVVSDFYVYQHTVNAACNKHIRLISNWIHNAQHLMANWTQYVMDPIRNMMCGMSRYKHLKDDDRKTLQLYTSKLDEMYTLSDNMTGFEEIHRIQNELKQMPRPNISKSQSMECEMRLQEKWRKYLSVRFGDEYVDPWNSAETESSLELSDEDGMSDIEFDDCKLVEMEVIDDDMGHVMNECAAKANDNESENASDGDHDVDNTEFIRIKHQRASASFMKTPPFLNEVKPFWTLQSDSPNEVESSDNEDGNERDLSKNSNSSAVLHSEEEEKEKEDEEDEEEDEDI